MSRDGFSESDDSWGCLFLLTTLFLVILLIEGIFTILFTLRVSQYVQGTCTILTKELCIYSRDGERVSSIYVPNTGYLLLFVVFLLLSIGFRDGIATIWTGNVHTNSSTVSSIFRPLVAGMPTTIIYHEHLVFTTSSIIYTGMTKQRNSTWQAIITVLSGAIRLMIDAGKLANRRVILIC